MGQALATCAEAIRPPIAADLPHNATEAIMHLPPAIAAGTFQRRTQLARTALHLGTGLLIALSLALATPAEARKKKAEGQQTVRIKKHPSGSGSGETRAERERRLTRECKGRPNAGACLGFAS